LTTKKEKTKGARRLFSRIADACRGLNYVSETDAAVEPVALGPARESTEAGFRKAAALPPDAKVESVPAETFFAPVTMPRPWHTAMQKKNAEGFAALRCLLEAELEDLRVYRVGRVRIDIYEVGVDDGGEWTGVRTKAVET
jgi:hypothetical protein